MNCSENDNLRNARVTHIIFTTTLGIPTVLMYIIILYILNKKSNRRKYGYTFFRLFTIVSSQLVWYLPFDIIMFRLLNTGFMCNEIVNLFSEPNRYLSFPYTIGVYAYYLVFYANTAISCNRMTCVLFPFYHRQLWDKHTKSMTIVLLALPLLTVWNVALGTVIVIPNTELGSVLVPLKYVNVSWLSNSFLMMIVASTCSGLILIFTLITVIALVMQRRRQSNRGMGSENNQAISAELSLLIVGTTMTISTLLVGASFAYFYFTLHILNDQDDDSPMVYRFIAGDIQAIVAPWLLVFVCKQVREDVIILMATYIPFCDQSRLIVPVRVTTQNASI